MSSEPVTLMTSVPIGKRPPHFVMIEIPTMKRASPPKPAPANTTRYLSKPRALLSHGKYNSKSPAGCRHSQPVSQENSNQSQQEPKRNVLWFAGKDCCRTLP